MYRRVFSAILLCLLSFMSVAQHEEEVPVFVNGFAVVRQDGDYTFINRANKKISNLRFQAARAFNEHLAAVSLNDKWGFINEDGRIVIDIKYDIVLDFKEGLTAVYVNGEWNIINKKGEEQTLNAIYYLENKRKIKLPGEPRQMPNRIAPASRNTAIPCPPNLAFENGNFTNWSCYIGSTNCSGGSNVTSMGASPPTFNRHTIIPRTTNSSLDPYGLFPINPPDGSNFCVKLGNTSIGAQAERIKYLISIPAGVSNYSINFRYAVVFEDPNHFYCEQPRFTARLYDPATGTYLPCGSFEFVSTSGLPGFSISSVNANVKYKPWASAFINLGPYAGRTLELEFTTVDCTRTGHWGYAYLDVDDVCDLSAELFYGCNSNAAILTAPSGFQTYNWWNSNFSALYGTGQTLTLNPAPPNGSTVWLEVLPYNGVGCRDTLPVTVNRIYPVANFNLPAAQCLRGNSFTFTSNSSITLGTITGKTWDFGDGSFGTGNSVTHTYSNPGTYTVKLLVESNLGCKDSITRTVVVHPPAVLVFNPPSAQCLLNNNFNFNAQPQAGTQSITNYTWNFGDNQTATVNPVSHSYSSPGNYQVKVKGSTVDGCADSVIHTVSVHPNPIAILVSPGENEFCEGTSVQLTASGGQTYRWYREGQLIQNVSGNILTVSQAGNYSVMAISSFGCTGIATAPVQLSVLTKPTPDFIYPFKCEGLPYSFTDRSIPSNSGALSYQWTFGDNTSSNLQHPTHTYNGGGNYHVTLKITPARCPNLATTITKKVAVEKRKPGIRYSIINALENRNTQLNARNFGVTYEWSPKTGLNDSKLYNPIFNYNQPLEYLIRITTNAGCVSVDTQLVRIFKDIDILVPKAFTPNGDGHNDKLNFYLVGIQQLKFFRVFNRWGQLLFETRDPKQMWDGRYKGTDQPLETYVWLAEGTGEDGKTIVRRGQTILIR